MKEKLTPEQKWENLTLADNFIFYKVMRHHPKECQHLIEMLLGIRIERMEMSNEETVEIDRDSHGIRLDVYVKDTGQIFDVEIQTTDTKDLPERSRYYQGLMDLDTLKTGQKYKDLKNSHVIFICMEDIFHNNLPVCTFENICLEDGRTKLNDRAWRHFFIARNCAKMIEDKEVRAFFEFLISNKSADNFTNELHGYVNDAKHNMQWRVQYMTWERQRTYDREEGMEIGARETAIANAKNLLFLNKLSDEEIASCCSLPLEQVLALKEELEKQKNHTEENVVVNPVSK